MHHRYLGGFSGVFNTMRNLRFVPFLALLFLWAAPSRAAIAHDADSNSGTPGNVSTFTWSHTCTGSNLVLVVAVFLQYSNVGDTTVTGVTYNGVSLTAQQTIDNSTGLVYGWIGYLKGPATGSNTVSVTLSRALGAAGAVAAGATSYTGVSQTSPIDASGFAVSGLESNGATYSQNITTVNANAWIVDALGGSTSAAAGSDSPVSPQTQRNFFGATSVVLGTSDHGPIATPASTSDGWNIVNFSSAYYALLGFSLNPAGGGTSGGGGSGGTAGIGGKAGMGE
jgi:hypothetical protein